MRRPKSEKLKLGEILIKGGVIDRMQLAAALGEQARWGRRLGETLIKMGMIEEIDLIRALATQFDLPVASLRGKRIADDVVALVTKKIASEHCVMPLFVKRGARSDVLYIGMADPANFAVLDDMTFRTGMEVNPVLVVPSELVPAIARYYLLKGSSLAGHCSPEDLPGKNSLRRVRGKRPAPRLSDSVASPETVSGASRPCPGSHSNEIDLELCDRLPALSEGLREDVAHAIAETQKTQEIAKAIAQLLIGRGVVSLEELRRQIAHQKSRDES